MKNTVVLIMLLFCSFAFAQETAKNIFDSKHEFKVGALKLLTGTILETTYEHIYSKNFTFGTSLLVNLKKNNDYSEDFSVTPFVRFYFQESKEYGAKGFFVEGFGKYSIGNNTFSFSGEAPKYSAGALGLSLGKKWINTSGFVFEILTGLGRVLGNSSSAPDFLFRGDLFVGYRF